MKFLILALLAIAGTLAEENYDGPEYAIKDYSMSMQPEDTLGLWNRIDEPLYKPPNDRHRRIFASHEAVPHSMPWVAYQFALLIGSVEIHQYCSVIVISPNAVLTAWMCLHQTANTQVIVGAREQFPFRLGPTEQRRLVFPSDYRFHPDTTHLRSRLAILFMPRAVTFNNYVQAVRLPTGFEGETFAGSRANSTCWGRADHSFSQVVRYMEVPVISNAECSVTFPGINDDFLCITVTEETGICGDVGGPLTVSPIVGDSRPILIGISVTPTSCNWREDVLKPQLYSRVANFLPWIMANH